MIYLFKEPEDAEDVDSEEFEDEEDYDDRPRKRKKKANDRFELNHFGLNLNCS